MIKGFAIGHHTADDDGWLTGTTVVLTERGAVGGVDVRGGAPGTRETDLLDPRALIEQVDAVMLSGRQRVRAGRRRRGDDRPGGRRSRVPGGTQPR